MAKRAAPLVPVFCCIDLTPFFGAQIRHAACNCYGLKKCFCCCEPCYLDWSRPIAKGVKDPAKFLIPLRAAVKKYAQEHNIPPAEVSVFDEVSDNFNFIGTASSLPAEVAMPPTQLLVLEAFWGF